MPDLLLQTALHPHLHGHGHRSSPASPSTACTTGCSFGNHHHEPSQTPSASSSHPNLLSGASSLSSTGNDINSAQLADLIAHYGTSSSIAWLDRERYKIWRPSQPILESDFIPVQGYLRKDPFVFAWGNPLVSSPAALEKTARAFIAFAEANHLRPVWSCVDHDLEAILSGDALGWATVSCIYEDVIDPGHIVELAGMEKDKEGGHSIRDLRRNLHRAEEEQVDVHEVKRGDWSDKDKEAVEAGIREWKAHRHGMKLDPMTLEPWVDESHRRYWIAKQKDKVVGVEILARTGPLSWQIVKCITFHHAPKGTSESLIHAALKDLHLENQYATETLPTIVAPEDTSASETTETPAESRKNRVTVSFGITAADHLEPGHNVGGWKVTVLGKTYQAVSGIVGLIKMGQYRNKFLAMHEPMFVCYPANGFGLIAVGALLMALRH
ncbi:unnamed protein product [Cyclocybe aegerita]|uniref:Phosphatidylglycerol lysyltransferase C-terminal domain-containing protein n=1 Tax=Cyclocybe aegerita TaxID=1973307 RepID=A0A8S0WDS7_CYCAE|nr:unnamed protein product [Cyclocybe aegerita]